MTFDLASIAAPPRSAPLSLLSAIARVTVISPLHVLRGRRLLALGLLSMLAPALVLLLRSFGVRDVVGAEMFRNFVSAFYVNGVFPLTCLFLGAAAIGDDIDDGTILYLRLRPMPRAAIVFGRYLAAVLSSLALFLPSLAVLYLLQVGGVGMEYLASYRSLLGGAMLGAVTSTLGYCAIFLLLGLVTRRAVIYGVIVIILQGALLAVQGPAAWLSVNLYTLTVLSHFGVNGEEIESVLMFLDDGGYLPSFQTALLAIAAKSTALLALASLVFANREYMEKPGE